MANKYIIHGATFCGDGTSSVLAASDGGVGAWNNINILEGAVPAYGTAVAGGDIVFIRSKTAVGADITRTLTATVTLGSAAATTANWVTWVLDNGTVWPGISGTLTYNCPSTFVVNIRAFNDYVAMTQDAFRIVETNAAAYYKDYFGADHTVYKLTNILFDFSANTSSEGCKLAQTGGSILTNLHIISRRRQENLVRCSEWNKLILINPTFELLDASQTSPVISAIGQTFVEVVGGSISGPGAVSGVTVFSVSGEAIFNAIGFQVPKAMRFMSRMDQTSSFTLLSGVGSDGAMGSVFSCRWGMADSRDDNNYPKLNATLPDTANTPWSWKLCPAAASERFPLEMPMSQYFTDTAGIREITVNLLIATTLTNVSKRSVWMTIDYTDNATGLKKSIHTRDYLGGALDVSTANWVPNIAGEVSYGSATLRKRKLSAVTPTAIKPNTPITVVLWSTVKAASTTDELGDIMFLDPEFSVT